MAKSILLIKKYKNRRLYNTENSTYINREELLEIIRNGREVQVQDASTGENVTIEALLQILIAESSAVLEFIPPELLHFLIRSNPPAIQEFFRSFETYFKMMMSSGNPPQNPFNPFGNTGFPNMFSGFQFPGMTHGMWPQQGSQTQETNNEDLNDLRQRLKALEQELERSRKKKN